MPALTLYHARHVFPVSREPIADGAVVVAGKRILAVGAFPDLRDGYPNARLVSLGEALLMPAAINAHTHLELTEYAGAVPEGLPFAEWIVAVVRAGRARTPADFQRAAEAGVRMLLANATAAVGEICTHGASVEPIVASGLRGVVYYELLGVDPEQAPAILARGQRQLQAWAERYPGAPVRFGLSLHTPYTVSARLFELAGAWCRGEGIPLCIHAAESPAESQWLLDGTGPIAETIYASAGWPIMPHAAPGCSPIAYLERLGALDARPLLVHGVRVSQGDLDLMARRGIAVAHCPRSNATLGCGRMPYAAYERAGVRVALGTDSLASAPTLSLWDEAAAAYATHHDAGEPVGPATVLRHATLDGAVALGVENELGTLESGKLAQLACASLSPLSEREREDAQSVLTALLEGRLEPAPVHP
jgi:5-methylthioadenosine/S-adenosylhomocysteine deaminase